jgi:hypothetical protein
MTHYWHVHHDQLVEKLIEPIEARIEYIKKCKPKNEIKTRLKLLKKATGIAQVWRDYWKVEHRAWKKYKEEYKKCNFVAWREYKKIQKSALRKLNKKLEQLHQQQCGCKEWDGKKIVFPKRSVEK